LAALLIIRKLLNANVRRGSTFTSKMHQKLFGSWALPGPTTELTALLQTFKLDLTGRPEGKGGVTGSRERRGWGKGGRE